MGKRKVKSGNFNENTCSEGLRVRTYEIATSLRLAHLGLLPAASFAQVAASISVAPPSLQVYEQPLVLRMGSIGPLAYWAYGESGYHWVAAEQPEPFDLQRPI